MQVVDPAPGPTPQQTAPPGPDAPPSVAVVVVNYNGRAFLGDCLASLARQTYPAREVVLVDNASSDGSADEAGRRFPEVRLIRHDRNLGFAAGVNAGIRATRSRYVATLNSDAEAEPDWLERLVAAAEADPSLGMVAARMVFRDRPDRLNSCGIALDPAGIAWDWRGGEPVPGEDAPAEVFGACAGAALYRRLMLDEIGLFDERFFLYLEDVDLAWRARLAGWRCRYEPGAVVRHRHSASAIEGSPLKSYHLGRNKYWTLAKNYPLPDLLRAAPVVALYDLAAVAYALVARRDLWALRGRVAGLCGLGAAVRARRSVQALRRDGGAGFRRALAPLESPLAVRRRYAHLRRGTESRG